MKGTVCCSCCTRSMFCSLSCEIWWWA